MLNSEVIAASSNANGTVRTLVLGYCHCMSIREIECNQEDINLFQKLLKHASQSVVDAVCVGLGRVVKDTSILFEMLRSNYIQCYHTRMNATAYLLIFNCWESSVDAVAELIEQHPDLLPIFVVELYNSIRHFTDKVIYIKSNHYCLVYDDLRYVEVASLIAVRMPTAFCAYIKDWHDGDNLKRALFYTSKQHDFPQRAACITILSVFGELTIELCEILVEGLRDDPYIQNTCYRCLNRIISIKDKKTIMQLLLSYSKSKSMNTRYVVTKMFLHLSKCSLIPLNQVQTALNELMLDPDSNEDLWLIKEQNKIISQSLYDYAGPLKNVVYSLLVQHLTSLSNETIRGNKLNDIDSDFIESEKASRLAACLYEVKTEENLPLDSPSKKVKVVD